MNKPVLRIINNLLSIILGACLLTSCNSGGGGGDDRPLTQSGIEQASNDCDGTCPNLNLSQQDVMLILRQSVASSQQLGVGATIAVVDRVGNVLAVYEMERAALTTKITGGRTGLVGGLEGIVVPSTLAAISKAGTAAYLSSQGNAFGTRTASFIIQENFAPLEINQPGGPLFGVQFSQASCSDVVNISPEFLGGLTTGSGLAMAGGLAGPRPMPLGLSGDPGGIPLYKNGDLVGGLGVELNGVYTIDLDPTNIDNDIEERIALSGTKNGFEIPFDRVAERIFVAGRALRLTDLSYSDLSAFPADLPELNLANLVAVAGFTQGGTVRAGAVFGEESSGVLRTNRGSLPAMTLVNDRGASRFPTRSGSAQGGAELTTAEVDAMLDSALGIASRLRAGIRRPLDSQAHVSIWVVDSEGTPLGFTRSPDAPVFGIDVALQKTRSAAFFSTADAGARLVDAGFGHYVDATKVLVGPTALTGIHAVSERTIGNMSRPFFLDGINGSPPGPLSVPALDASLSAGAPSIWSPFNTGLQLDLLLSSLTAPLLRGVIPADCAPALGGRLRNGLQIFPGAVPLYRGHTLVGAIGVSGDGIDQDDAVAFLGASRKGLDLANHREMGDPELGFNAPKEIRADQIDLNVPRTRLRYVSCPEAPFRGSNEQNVCDGL